MTCNVATQATQRISPRNDNADAPLSAAEALEWQAGFSKLAQRHALWEHPFVVRCRDSVLEVSEVAALAIQMYKFSREFNVILARALAACPEEAARVVIAENLWEELGEGNSEATHPALFRRFTRALGITDHALEEARMEPETKQLIATYCELPDRHGYVAAIAAICYASEGIVRTLYTQLERGIRATVNVRDEDLVFFDLHIRVDDGHAAHLERLIRPRLGTMDDATQIERAIRIALDARCRFFDGVVRAAETMPALVAS